eukprot:5115061-Pyramimonas_sp.AAC.1
MEEEEHNELMEAQADEPDDPGQPQPEPKQPEPEPKPETDDREQEQHEPEPDHHLINIVESPGWWFNLKGPPPPGQTNNRAGNLRRIKSSIKATCSIHKMCALHVCYKDDVPGDDQKVIRALTAWLDRGVPMQRDGRQKDAYHIKVNEFNMKPRVKPAKDT